MADYEKNDGYLTLEHDGGYLRFDDGVGRLVLSRSIYDDTNESLICAEVSVSPLLEVSTTASHVIEASMGASPILVVRVEAERCS